MHIVSTGYSFSPDFSDPEEWLEKISFYTGILECLGKTHRVTSIEQIAFNGTIRRGNVEFYFLSPKGNELSTCLYVNAHIKKLNPDVVLVNGLIFPMQVVQLRMLLGKKVKIILLHRAELPATGLKLSLQKFADKFINAYAFISMEMAKPWLGQGFIRSKEKILEVMDASSIFERSNRPHARMITRASGSPIFLWVGRLEKNKDPVTVVKAFIEYARFFLHAKLYLIFQDDELLPDISNLISSDSNSERVFLLGKKSKDELQHWYNSADFFVSGSHHEGSGIAVVEAMSCGCIPILTNIPSFRKLTADGEIGCLYEAGDVDSLVRVMNIASRVDVDLESKRVLERFSEEFSFEACAQKINNRLNMLTSKAMVR
jgi:glycosyltransferase involved in cell wall biosynthesis